MLAPQELLLRPGLIDVSIGPPMPSAGREPEELMREVEAWIEAEMRRLDPEAYDDVAVGQPVRAH
jgi:1-acyl-sn-glycerol-3-phosphate acyltransferase